MRQTWQKSLTLLKTAQFALFVKLQISRQPWKNSLPNSSLIKNIKDHQMCDNDSPDELVGVGHV